MDPDPVLLLQDVASSCALSLGAYVRAGFRKALHNFWAALVAQTVKNLPAVQQTQETRVPSVGGEDLLEEKMATQSNSIAWEIPWTDKPGRLHSMGLQRVRHN